jgi:microcystin-dependent protein
MANYKIQFKDAHGNLYYPNTLNGENLGGESLPIGSMIPYSSEVIPNGFLPCDGSEVSRTEYKDLFAVIGITYGEGDGETTFNLPDKRGRVSVGLDEVQDEFNTLGKKGGSKFLQAHKHNVLDGSYSTPPNVFGYNDASGYNVPSIKGIHSNGTGGKLITDTVGTGDSGNLQPYEVDQWIIKAFNGGYNQPVSGDVNDTLPVGSIIKFDGDYIPDGYEEVENYELIYSLEEKRIGTWLDKPLYRKVIYVGTVTSAIVDIQHGIENPDLVIDYKGRFTRPNTTTQNVIPATSYTDWQTWLYDFTPTSIRLRLSNNQVNAGIEKLYVIIDYTKTTD